MAGASLLRVDGLTMQYAEGGGVSEISFEVCDGEIVGLLGPNGSGKSTTLHCIIGINEVPVGSVTLLDLPHHLPAAKNVFGFLPDDLPLPESLRMPEIFALNRRLRPGFDEGMATELVNLLGLAGHTEKYIGQYSHGMKRKLQLVTALAHRPRLLILDEPLRGLDPEAALLLRAILEFFSENGGGVLVATHDLLAAEQYCQRIVVLREGNCVAAGRPTELLRESGARSLEEYFVQVTGIAARVNTSRAAVRRIFMRPAFEDSMDK
jgi:ABC-type multidrug transport system ATPase subunit